MYYKVEITLPIYITLNTIYNYVLYITICCLGDHSLERKTEIE